MNDIINYWKYELKQVFKDAGVIIFFLVVPFAYPVLYGIIYNPEIVHEVPMVVVDLSHSSSSREFIRKNDASPEVKIVAIVTGMEEAIRMTDKKEAYGILVIPKEFSKNLHTERKAVVKLYCDMSSLLYYKAFLLTATEVSLDMGKELLIENLPGNSSKMDEITANPVNHESIALYNPQNGFATFLLPAILVLVIQQTLLLGVGMLAGTRRSSRHTGPTFPEARISQVLWGRFFAYLTIYMIVCFWALIVVPHLFKLPQMASFYTIALFALPYLSACIFFSMAISCFVKSREIPMMIFVFTSLPLLFISGISWPGSSIPVFWEWVSYIFPSTFGIRGFIKINSAGAELPLISFEYMMLWIQAFVFFIITFSLYQFNARGQGLSKEHFMMTVGKKSR
ncbi:MAG: ABC transporter permease [Dysgonamonadaceae bacterium]|nr:ABC transporter permease [Dysgonamonadaceae bacterium]